MPSRELKTLSAKPYRAWKDSAFHGAGNRASVVLPEQRNTSSPVDERRSVVPSVAVTARESEPNA